MKLDKNRAKKIAETITQEQLNLMFENAKNNIKNWKEISYVNKGMTKGAAWNILKSVKVTKDDFHKMGVTNAIWEFGEFLSEEILNKLKKEKKIESQRYIHHEEPKFD